MITGIIPGASAARLLSVSELWHQYATAMGRRRPGKELGHNQFGWHLRHRSHVFVYNKTAIVGAWQDDTFWVSHFCPATRREGVEALKELRQQPHKVGFAVTEDLKGMLLKLGYNQVGNTPIPVPFRNDVVMKWIFTN